MTPLRYQKKTIIATLGININLILSNNIPNETIKISLINYSVVV